MCNPLRTVVASHSPQKATVFVPFITFYCLLLRAVVGHMHQQCAYAEETALKQPITNIEVHKNR
jgi:hypothetical protein